jgi:hypothetical protein
MHLDVELMVALKRFSVIAGTCFVGVSTNLVIKFQGPEVENKCAALDLVSAGFNFDSFTRL